MSLTVFAVVVLSVAHTLSGYFTCKIPAKKSSFESVVCSTQNLLMMCLCVCVRLGRLCVHWSRTTQPGNRGWPSSWSRWWPSWVWRAEDRTSQGALGRDPIRNRAVPERRPVPPPKLFSSCDFLPPPFKDDFFLDLFFCFLFPPPSRDIFVFLIHSAA